MKDKIYLCIDLKTFFASVECIERNLDPFQTNLVVADPSRGKGGICLAITPKMKAMGIRNRCRIYEIPDNVEYITALPRMKYYIEYAAKVYGVYLKYISPDDIHVYSIDEAFLDVTDYLALYNLTAKQLTRKILNDIYDTLGLSATAGIGTNLYLAKVALDITAKHTKENIAYLDEEIFKETLWHHQPLMDFWHIGPGIQKRLFNMGIYDMYGITKADSKQLYKVFGVNAEYIIDHAYGKEPTTIKDIKSYKSDSHSVGQSQVLFEDYKYQDALLVIKEMVELKVLDLVDNHLVTNHISLGIGYSNDKIKRGLGSMKLDYTTNSCKILTENFIALFKRLVNPDYNIRRISISFDDVKDEAYESYDLFTDTKDIEKEKKVQDAILKIKKKYGKNAVIKGMNLQEKATTTKRNKLIGGHNAQ